MAAKHLLRRLFTSRKWKQRKSDDTKVTPSTPQPQRKGVEHLPNVPHRPPAQRNLPVEDRPLLHRAVINGCEQSNPQLSCRLIQLPGELRNLIWMYAIGGNCIIIYQKKNRITHGILDSTNTRVPGRVFNLTEASVRFEIENHLPRGTWENRSPPRKARLLTLAKTCRIIYRETIGLLYSANTFACLHNSAFASWHNRTPPHHFARIRVLHVHWQLLHPLTSSYIPDPDIWLNRSLSTLCRMPQLEHLSIFMQGVLWWRTCDALISAWTVTLGRKPHSLKTFAVRLPPVQAPASLNPAILGALEEKLRDPALPMRIHRPDPLLDGRQGIEDVGLNREGGWRVGNLFVGSPSEGLDGMWSYAVYIPPE